MGNLEIKPLCQNLSKSFEILSATDFLLPRTKNLRNEKEGHHSCCSKINHTGYKREMKV